MGIKKNIIVIGSSTGGPRVLERMFMDMPELDASIILVQHMAGFSNGSFCKRLGKFTGMGVKVASDGEEIQKGMVYLAPSGLHLELVENMYIRLLDGDKVNFVKPAADVAMRSLQGTRDQLFGVVLTGLGADGAAGICHIKGLGGTCIAQDKDTSVIYGMPKAAVETGCVDKVLPPDEIRDALINMVGVRARSRGLRN